MILHFLAYSQKKKTFDVNNSGLAEYYGTKIGTQMDTVVVYDLSKQGYDTLKIYKVMGQKLNCKKYRNFDYIIPKVGNRANCSGVAQKGRAERHAFLFECI